MHHFIKILLRMGAHEGVRSFRRLRHTRPGSPAAILRAGTRVPALIPHPHPVIHFALKL